MALALMASGFDGASRSAFANDEPGLSDEARLKLALSFIEKMRGSYDDLETGGAFTVAADESPDLSPRHSPGKSPALSEEDRLKLGRSFVEKMRPEYSDLERIPGADPSSEGAPFTDPAFRDLVYQEARAIVNKELRPIERGTAQARAGIPEEAGDEDLILQPRIDGALLSDIYVLYRDGIAYVSLDSLFQAVDFPISVLAEEGTASGWFLREVNRFEMSGGALVTVTVKNSRYRFARQNLVYEAGDIFVPIPYLKDWFGLALSVAYRDQTMLIRSDHLLPIQERLARESAKGRMQVGGLPETSLPRRDLNYQMASIPFVDAQVSAGYEKSADETITDLKYSFIGSGDLMKMSANYFVGGNNDEPLANLRLSLYRESMNFELLGPLQASYLGIGDMTTRQVPIARGGGSGLGVRISNNPLGAISNRQTTTLRGNVQPGWDVELYRNGQLIEALTAKDDGLYEFEDVVLYYGENKFKVMMFGPQGQVREVRSSVPLNGSAMSGGGLIYDVSVMKKGVDFASVFDEPEDKNDYWQFSSYLEKSVTGSTYISGGFINQKFDDGSLHGFAYGGANVFVGKAMVSANYVDDIKGGNAIEFDTTSKIGMHSIRFGYDTFRDGFRKNSADQSWINTIVSGGASGPLFKFSNGALNYGLTGSHTQFIDDGAQLTGSFSVGGRYGRWMLANNIQGLRLEKFGQVFNQSVAGSINLSRNFDRVRLRANAAYSLDPDVALTNVAGDIYWSAWQDKAFRVSGGYAPESGKWTASGSMTWNADRAAIVPSIKYNSEGDIQAGLAIKFGFGPDPFSGSIRRYNQGISRTGSVAARIFEDQNMDGLYDEGEPLIEGAEVTGIQARRKAVSGPSGIAYLTGLRRNVPTDVKLDNSTLVDPFWVSATPGTSFSPRAGKMMLMDIPVITSTEVEGTIRLKQKSGNLVLGQNIPMFLKDLTGRIVDEVNSTFDGFYLFTGVRPGRYMIMPDADYLKKRSIQDVVALEINVVGDGDILSEQDFTALKEGAERFLLDEVEDGVPVRVLFLGDYKSSLSLKIAWLNIRKELPAQVRHLVPVVPFRTGLIQNQDGTFPLMLGLEGQNARAAQRLVCKAAAPLTRSCELARVTLPEALLK